jgi:hypothetical protein
MRWASAILSNNLLNFSNLVWIDFLDMVVFKEGEKLFPPWSQP